MPPRPSGRGALDKTPPPPGTPANQVLQAPECCPTALLGGLSFSVVFNQLCSAPSPPSVTPHSPNTCIYSKVLNRVSPDLEWAQAGAASPMTGCSCVPGSELDPVSGLPVSATCLGGLGLPFIWHPETKQSSNWTQLCPEKAALVTPSPSPTWLSSSDGALGPRPWG